jgi:restriction system protein
MAIQVSRFRSVDRKSKGQGMIPNYQQFMRPFLEIAFEANGSEVKLRDVINLLADKFNLTEEERNQTIPSGKQSVLDNRVGWARTYLTKAKLLKTVKRAHFVITERGIQALQDTNTVINNEYLKQFDEIRCIQRTKKRSR